MPSLRTNLEKLAVEQNTNTKRQKSGSPEIEAVLELPPLPAPVKDFAPYFSNAKDTPVLELLEPYHAYEAELRKFYAQQPDDPVMKDGHINTVPIYAGQESSLKVRARKLDAETEAEKEKYLLSLSEADRKPDGSPAVVASLKEFQSNFNLFSESSLSELDWSNVVAAGSSVTTSLLPVPEKWSGSKKSLREYYHDRLAPASDVDLFLYGLTEEEGLEKIKHIETTVKDSILHEVTTIRTKNAITIASQYPTRHVQIVLRLYDSISQIITGFDVDCACVAYDGKEVYGSPRALAAFSTQTNTIDLTRRSPSYENRLSKYSHRGFEVHWPDLDRSRVDPTIFERAFRKTLGLSRLLVLEKLPQTVDRERYTDERRKERGRPAVDRYVRDQHKLFGNIKDEQEDEVADWAEEDQVSNYHTMVVPYGKRFTARKIERVLYTKDLLLNSEWNRPKEREVDLHRHPCFFGTAEDVLGDCCGFCPVPKTDEEIEIAEEESKTYISGSLTFVKDDPGRQEIGSFNPITTDDWTEMAYVGNTQMLCQAIVDGDIDYITSWCEQEGNDVNTRDYVGRAPLHLAVINGNADIVKVLIDNGAKIIARLLDGRCALHIAAQLGHADIIKVLMDKSLANEEEEAEKEDKLRAAKLAAKKKSGDDDEEMEDADGSDSEGSGMEVETEDDSDNDSETQGFTKVKEAAPPGESNDIPDDDEDEPDFYDINVVAWDLQCTALHFAIMGGHIPVIRMLVGEYGADVLLPIKIGTKHVSNQAILSTVLATALKNEKARDVIDTLLQLGATSAQADMDHYTALHYVVERNRPDLLNVFYERDGPAVKSVLNLVTMDDYRSARTMVSMAIQEGGEKLLEKLLSLGGKPGISFEDFIKCYFAKNEYAKNNTAEQNMKTYKTMCSQPIVVAAVREMPMMVVALLVHGADPNTITIAGQTALTATYAYNSIAPTTVLDVVQRKLRSLRDHKRLEWPANKVPTTLHEEAYYLKDLKPGTYKYWTALNRYRDVKAENDTQWISYKKSLEVESGFDAAVGAKMSAIQSLIAQYEELEEILIEAGAKTFKQAHSHIKFLDAANDHRKPDPPFNPDVNINTYETLFSFSVPALSDYLMEGHFRLFEAVWNNDIDEVKSLTLRPWKSEDGQEQPALQIAVKDTVPERSQPSGNVMHGFNYRSNFVVTQKAFAGVSPFSLAVLRGPSHYRMAKVIVEIALAQYEPRDNEGGKSRWSIDYDQAGCCSDRGSDSEDSDDDDHSQIGLRSELIDEVFTIDNVAALSTVIKSHVKPMDMLHWPCNAIWFVDEKERPKPDVLGRESSLVYYAIVTNDTKLLRFLYQIAEEQAVHFPNEPISPVVALTQYNFDQAIRLGRTEILGEMIRRTGVGIPLDHLVESSGVKLPEEKPHYYQGLNVGGKKNARWAQAGNPNGDTYVYRAKEITPPLLKAAKFGNLESVQWFLSDLPTTKYLEFAATHENDKRVVALSKSENGFKGTATKWLSMRHELLLHVAVIRSSEDGLPELMELVKYIAKGDASLLESRSLGGFTPLHLACTRHSKDVIEILLALGSKVRSRDATGRNMIHHLICPGERSPTWTEEWEKRNNLASLFSLFKKSDVTEMLLERDILGFTPFALWQSQWDANSRGESAHASTIPEIVCSYTEGQHLTIMNSVGDLPLHVAIKQGRPLHVREFLLQNPQTLGRENATGITALELAQQKLQSATVEGLKTSARDRAYAWRNKEIFNEGLESKDWREFKPKEAASEDPKERMKAKLLKGDMKDFQAQRWVLEECLEAAERVEADGGVLKRRLVSLGEANEVARRIVVAQAKASAARIQQHYLSGNAGEEEGGKVEWDEVVAAMVHRGGQGWVLRGRAVVNIV